MGIYKHYIDFLDEWWVDEETLQIWIEDFKAEGRDLQEEIDDIKGTISNEQLWLKGSFSEEEINNHKQNIVDLTAYLEWLRTENRKEKGESVCTI